MSEKSEIVELIDKIKENTDQFALEKLIGLYTASLQKTADYYKKNPAFLNYTENEIYQEIVIAFERAAQTYRAETGYAFYTYAMRCIRNRMISNIRKIKKEEKRKQTDRPGSVAVSPVERDSEMLSAAEIQDVISDSRLSAREATVFELFIAGKSYKEIAMLLGCDFKSVDNAMMRARSKIRRKFKERRMGPK